MHPIRFKRLAWLFCVLLSPLAEDSARSESATIYRDEFGVPHIYAKTLRGVAFASGYAQAEDRLVELLRNYRKAAGTMAEAFGPKYVHHDYRQRLWQHERVARENFSKLDAELQSACGAFIAGVNRYMSQHPQQVPEWAPKLEPHFPVMLGRFIIWAWPEGQAGFELRKAGIRPDKVSYRGSNQWLVAPERTAVGVPIALIDPHLGWYGEHRFYEIRQYASDEDFAVSGAAILGIPMPTLGHSQYTSIAMTTGGPDAADVYEETVNPDNPHQYRVDGSWRDMTVRRETIRVAVDDGFEEQHFDVLATHHGPVWATKDDHVYTMATPYLNEVELFEELNDVMRAKNLDEIKTALSSLQMMPQNVMIGTVDGDIYYLRAGRVPIRKHGLSTYAPVPGHDSKNDFAGIHPLEDLVQITNPASGYMQNCNIAPQHMMKNSPLVADKYPAYIFNAGPGPAHQRAGMVLELLDRTRDMTAKDALDLAFSTQVLGADAWQRRLESAWESAPTDSRDRDAKTLFAAIQQWNRRSDPDSVGAFAFYSFKRALGDHASAVEVPADLADSTLITALGKAAKKMRTDHGRVDVKFGDVFRVGRTGTDDTYPVGGGTLANAGMATPRAILFSRKGKQYVGRGGQTSTQVVILTKPPKSYMVLPLGQSDHPESDHWDDQAEKLFSNGRAKDTFFMNLEGLKPHITSTTNLEF